MSRLPQLVFRKPDVSELFVAALRQLAFEEPTSRFARMRKTVIKFLGKNLDAKPLLRIIENNYFILAQTFGQIFGPNIAEQPSLSQVLSLAIGLDDLRVFSDAALNSWYQPWHQRKVAQAEKIEPDLSPKMLALIDHLTATNSVAARAWLTTCLLSSVDWQFNQLSTLRSREKAEDLERVLVVQDIFVELKAQIGKSGPIENLGVEALADLVWQCANTLAGKLRPNLLLLVEGQTEAIVLPHFARLQGLSFSLSGVEVIASGGAKQVARRYLTIKDTVRLPVICVLDGDAVDAAELIDDSLRERDQLVSLAVIELEDSYPADQLYFLLDEHLVTFGQRLTRAEFDIPESGRRKNALNKIFRKKGLGDFDKIAFAHQVVQSCSSTDDVPQEMTAVIDAVRLSLLGDFIAAASTAGGGGSLQ